MRIRVSRKALLEAVGVAEGAVAARTTKPIMSSLLLRAAGTRLTVTGFDTEVAAVRRVECAAVEREGATTLGPKELRAILAECGADEVALDAAADGCRVAAGRGKWDLRTYPVEEFPEPPAADPDGPHWALAAGELAAMIGAVKHAADKTAAATGGRFALGGVLWASTTDEARLVATDTKRLAVARGKCAATGHVKDSGGPGPLLPLKAVTAVEKQLTDPGEAVKVYHTHSEAWVTGDRWSVYTRLMEGRFPPWKDVLAHAVKKAGAPIEADVASVLTAFKQAAILTDDESKRVDVTFSPGHAVLTTRGSESGSSEVVLDLPGYAGTGKVAFDPKFVIELLAAAEGERVTIRLDPTGKSGALFDIGPTQYMVMPLADQ